MQRFFIDPHLIADGQATVTGQDARHIGKVLRLKPGVRLELFDGSGTIYEAEIKAITKAEVKTKILSQRRHHDQPPFLSLAQALLKGKKMDLVIQKATELGAIDIQPVLTRHCVAAAPGAAQIERWQRIANEACKQCDRPLPPLCRPGLDLTQLLSQPEAGVDKIFCWEEEKTATLADLDLRPARKVMLLLGPEGGFAPEEAATAIANGFKPVSLGPRVLRAETAAIAALAIVQFLLGNLRAKDRRPALASPPPETQCGR